MTSTPPRESAERARRRRSRRSRTASAIAGSNTRSRSAAGTKRRSAAAASGMDDPRPGGAVGIDGVAVERARRRPGRVAASGQRLAPLLDDLAVAHLLVVLAGDEPRILEPRHHLVEGRSAPIDAVPLQRASDHASRPLTAAQHPEDEELEVRDFRDTGP